MKPTLRTQQAEMRSSFAHVHVRIDDQDNEMRLSFANVHVRIDDLDSRLSQRIDDLDDRLSQRFCEIDRRFDKLPSDLVEYLSPFISSVERILDNHEKRISAIERT